MSAKHCEARLSAGQLSIASESCSLREVLETIREATGAVLDWSGSDGDEIAFIVSGPGDPAPIVSSILYGTPWNFIITSDYSGSIKRIVLSTRPPSISNSAASAVTSKTANISSGNQAKEQSERKVQPTLTVRKQLPPGIPQKMYDLYPSLFQATTGIGIVGNTTTKSVSNETTLTTTSTFSSGQIHVPVTTPVIGANGLPVLPANIPPAMWNLYPPNLVQLISGPRPAEPIPIPPATPPGQVTLIDQVLPAKPP
jgi:hypothetical protein